MDLTASPAELLDVIRELFPREFDRASAELVIRKQAEHIASLQAEVERLTTAGSAG